MDVSALFVNYNSWGLLAQAIGSLEETFPEGLSLEVVVVDNASPLDDPEARGRVQAAVERIGGTVILHDSNDGYGPGMNLAARHSSGRHLLVCNPDIVLMPGCVEGLVRFLDAHPDVWVGEPEPYAEPTLEVQLPVHILPTVSDLFTSTLAVASRHFNAWNNRRRTRAAVPVWGSTEPQDLLMFGGCCFLVPRVMLDEIGFFDERYPLYFEDTDLAMRVRRAGRRITRVPGARVVHLYDRSAATARELAETRYQKSRTLFFRKWYGRLGAAALALNSRISASTWVQGRAQERWRTFGREIDRDEEGPLIRLPRSSARFVVEIAYEPFFLLTAAAFGSGDHWRPSATIVSELKQAAWFRVVDLENDAYDELGCWRYTPPA